MALAKHPKLLEVVTAVLGPDIILLDSRFICKYPVSKMQKSNGVIQPNNTCDKEKDGIEKPEAMPFVAWHQDMK